VDRRTRKGLKTDKFAQEVSHGWDWLAAHRAEVMRYGAIALVVVALAAGIAYYLNHQTTVREDALAQALHIDDATIGANAGPGMLNYVTQEEKDKARAKAFGDIAAKYRGTAEGAIAALYLTSDVADKGNLAAAEKSYKDIVDSAPKDYAALARLALAQVYAGEGRMADAEKLLRYAIANPTPSVSKAAATIALARLLEATNPAEARKLVDPLKTERTAVSRAAVGVLGDLAQNAQ
jgi:predicted negative regulator of RcsB-dependent stress response